MYKGDISNELPKRVLVTTDVFLTVNYSVRKVFKIIPKVEADAQIDRSVLSYLYLYTTRRGVTLEAVSFDMSEEQMLSLEKTLDEAGTNPFRYFSAYKSIEALIDELPYRPEVAGVMDIPSRQLRYGHWGLDNV